MNENAEFRALSVRLPEDLHAQLRASAAAHERSWGGEIRHIVKAYLADAPPHGSEGSLVSPYPPRPGGPRPRPPSTPRPGPNVAGPRT